LTESRLGGIPQIAGIVSLSAKGEVTLKKAVRNHLRLGKASGGLCLKVGEEVLLTATSRKPVEGMRVKLRGNRLLLPQNIVERLGLEKGSYVAMIQRSDAVALKRLDVEERQGKAAKVYDVETASKVTRVAETSPMPEVLIPRVVEKYGDEDLRYDVRMFLRGRRTLDAWKARKLLGVEDDTDKELGRELIRERLDKQAKDGSWGSDVILTARNLRELTELGLNPEVDEMKAGAEWLLNRPRSEVNPGMFFLTDELVAEQARIVERIREACGGILPDSAHGVLPNGQGRFRNLKISEVRQVAAGDDLFPADQTTHNRSGGPCGPRIMWPNALVLETLLLMGYEEHERIQTAFSIMLRGNWCECVWQLGYLGFRTTLERKTAKQDTHTYVEPTIDEVEGFARDRLAEYRYGGISTTETLAKMDLSKTGYQCMPRISYLHGGCEDVFLLRMPTGTSPCTIITVRAISRIKDLSQARNQKMKRVAEAYLWPLAATQNPENGYFGKQEVRLRYYYLLDICARYDHPASKLIIIRSIPWIIEAQNEDGSWGDETHKDPATYAVLAALRSIDDYLPQGLKP
jgi:bifunctional DNA-binding transcriptional regulator/antitoxin component of YhaV-PrlF toxin-antitoxin module